MSVTRCGYGARMTMANSASPMLTTYYLLTQVAQPLRLKLDFLTATDRIDSVFCGWFQTFIRTHRGKIYHSTVGTERKKKKPQ